MGHNTEQDGKEALIKRAYDDVLGSLGNLCGDQETLRTILELILEAGIRKHGPEAVTRIAGKALAVAAGRHVLEGRPPLRQQQPGGDEDPEDRIH